MQEFQIVFFINGEFQTKSDWRDSDETMEAIEKLKINNEDAVYDIQIRMREYVRPTILTVTEFLEHFH